MAKPGKLNGSSSSASPVVVGLAQIAPVWLDRAHTINKILTAMSDAAKQGAHIVSFGEALLPGYPFWLDRTDGAKFNSPKQKEIHTLYLKQAVDIEAGDIAQISTHAAQLEIAVILGVAERASNRGGHSIYCSLIYIDNAGVVQNVHRKLMPTYEERLTWASGDGHGLRTFPFGDFTLGALNCWENWMPLARAALYGQGENLHFAIWPGSEQNTYDITKFIAKEARSYVVSTSSLMRPEDFPSNTPYLDEIVSTDDRFLANGGSCVAGPDGEWLLAPQVGSEAVYCVALDYDKILEERQNFDPAGHYSRPDVTELSLNQTRQQTVRITNK